MPHTLPKLGYDYTSLEPHIDSETMEIHHSKHHQGYVNKLNAALENYPKLQEKPVFDLLKNLTDIPEEVRTAVRNHGGGHANHTFFWPLLKKDVELKGEIKDAIMRDFGSFEAFKERFTAAATGQFGSGWAWLVLNNEKKLDIISTANQNTPLSKGLTPLLAIDVWEHAYYLSYRNRRAEYIKHFFSIINWDQVNEHYRNAQ